MDGRQAWPMTTVLDSLERGHTVGPSSGGKGHGVPCHQRLHRWVPMAYKDIDVVMRDAVDQVL